MIDEGSSDQPAPAFTPLWLPLLALSTFRSLPSRLSPHFTFLSFLLLPNCFSTASPVSPRLLCGFHRAHSLPISPPLFSSPCLTTDYPHDPATRSLSDTFSLPYFPRRFLSWPEERPLRPLQPIQSWHKTLSRGLIPSSTPAPKRNPLILTKSRRRRNSR